MITTEILSPFAHNISRSWIEIRFLCKYFRRSKKKSFLVSIQPSRGYWTNSSVLLMLSAHPLRHVVRTLDLSWCHDSRLSCCCYSSNIHSLVDILEAYSENLSKFWISSEHLRIRELSEKHKSCIKDFLILLKTPKNLFF